MLDLTAGPIWPARSTSFVNEAEAAAVVTLVAQFLRHAGHAPTQVRLAARISDAAKIAD